MAIPVNIVLRLVLGWGRHVSGMYCRPQGEEVVLFDTDRQRSFEVVRAY
jgi:hypothetical protein